MRNQLYYRLKPFMPWRLRMGIRRVVARRLRQRAPEWPFHEPAAQRPSDWPGWPNGKRFAFVLTHDVEGREGLARVRRLAELEISLGFRSSFNFVPEGEYTVPTDLLDWLRANGFEVGVHDLHHDGSLYRGRAGFRKRALKINQHLKSWGAVGFRSGFMLNNLEWIHDLDIQYDASTFDYDPFEPQPQGAGTIFPFWVAGVAGGDPDGPARLRPGYVELPYSVPQDSTLFLLLQETTPAIWLKKFEWVAQRGGMALVNVHPDYLQFEGESRAPKTYPVDFYVQLLKSARRRADESWNALARDVAGWYRSLPRGPRVDGAAANGGLNAGPNPARAHAALSKRRAAVLLYSSYPSDSRPRRAAEAMAAAGAEVEMICLQENPPVKPRETIAGVRVTRVPLHQRRGGKWVYAYQYGVFFAWCTWLLLFRCLRRRYDVVHVHNMPDFLVWAAWPPKRLGAKIILDLHDPMPELFMSLYKRDRDDYLIQGLCEIEKHSIGFANLVLTPNESFRERFVSRSGAYGKVKIVMNSPEEAIFCETGAVEDSEPAGSRPFRLMYHGLIAERHGLDIAVEALAVARRQIPRLSLDIFGAPNAYLDSVMALAAQRGVEDCIARHGMVTERVIAENILRCDLGVIPNRLSAFTAINLPTRIFEYLIMNRLVIVPETQGIQDYFSKEELLFFKPNDPSDLANQIVWAWKNPIPASALIRRGRSVLDRHRWPLERARLMDLVSNLVAPCHGAVDTLVR